MQSQVTCTTNYIGSALSFLPQTLLLIRLIVQPDSGLRENSLLDIAPNFKELILIVYFSPTLNQLKYLS